MTLTLKKKFPEIKFQYEKKAFLKTIDDYGITIHNYDTTSFLEAMAFNKPSLIINPLLDNNFSSCRNDSISFYRNLEKANILHSSNKSIFAFLSMIEYQFNDWWYSKEVQSIWKQFCKNFASQNKNTINELTQIIKSS